MNFLEKIISSVGVILGFFSGLLGINISQQETLTVEPVEVTTKQKEIVTIKPVEVTTKQEEIVQKPDEVKKITKTINKNSKKQPINETSNKKSKTTKINSKEKNQTNFIKEKRTDNKTTEITQNILSYIDDDIQELKTILTTVQNSREKYISFSENISQQRYNSLKSLLSVAPDNDLKEFIQKGMNDQQKRKQTVRSDYEKFFGILENGIKEYMNELIAMRDNIIKNNNIQISDLESYISSNNKKVNNFIELFAYMNERINNREKIYSEGYEKYLGYIGELNSTSYTTNDISIKLLNIEKEFDNNTLTDDSLKCWATTKYSGGINGISETALRCE